ncbi:YjjG family noncanonical pyrimidine nucleotidase [Gaetbulibacter aestuarii]|uniref:YjjG family noncanonical pyrimidine nucleotidase n=1 Tax=Gaetbulibacter aestuarii TaxID=1502358 RepID=A0ABW7MX07_9FLAO
MKIKGITDVFFDLDHTLWDFDKNSALTFDKIFKSNAISVNLNEFIEVYEPINLNYWKLYRENRISKSDLRFKRLDDAFRALDIVLEAEQIHMLSEDYITWLSSFNHLFDHTEEILNYLSNQYKLHIITNGFEEVQHKKLTHSNIIHYFDTITNSESVGVKKPHPDIFHHALKQANTSSEKSVMIGDNYEADVLGARDIGMEVIFFNIRNDAIDEVIPQINHLSLLKNYL